MNRLFDDFFGGWPAAGYEGRWALAIDVSETQDAVKVRAEIPGMNSEDIDISLTGDTLTIKGEKKEEETKQEENFTRIERSYGAFQRVVALPSPVDPQHVDAGYKNGILTVNLEKKEESKPRSIDIKVE